MPAFDFTPIWIALAGVVFLSYAVACVTTTDGRAFARVFGALSAACGLAVLLAGAAAWAAWEFLFG